MPLQSGLAGQAFRVIEIAKKRKTAAQALHLSAPWRWKIASNKLAWRAVILKIIIKAIFILSH